MRVFLLSLLTIYLNACSFLSTSPSADSLSLQFKDNQNDAYAYGVGTGTTKEEATLSARLDLSSQVYVHVSSEFKAAQLQVRSEEHTSELQSRPHLVCR